MKKVIGWIMVCVAAAIIIYNVKESKANEENFAEHPWTTLLSGGENLSDVYSFTPPYTEFEVIVMAAGIIGLVLILIPKNNKAN